MTKKQDSKEDPIVQLGKWVELVEKTLLYRQKNSFDQLFIFDEGRVLKTYLSMPSDNDQKERLYKTYIEVFGNYCKSFRICADLKRVGVLESLESLVAIIQSLDRGFSILLDLSLELHSKSYSVSDIYEDLILAYDIIFTKHRGLVRYLGDTLAEDGKN